MLNYKSFSWTFNKAVAQAGEVREWADGKYQKQADGSWKKLGVSETEHQQRSEFPSDEGQTEHPVDIRGSKPEYLLPSSGFEDTVEIPFGDDQVRMQPVTVHYDYEAPDPSVGYAGGVDIHVMNQHGEDITEQLSSSTKGRLADNAMKDLKQREG